MAVKALKCPNCDANIKINDEKEYGFCTYCGAQVQVREVVEVRYTGEVQIKDNSELEKQIEDGTAYIKMKDYYKAEQIFSRMINKHPGEVRGYEMLICAITREHTLYIKENYDRVMKLSEKMLAVAPEEKKDYYEQLCGTIRENFETGLLEQNRQNNLLKVAKRNKQIKDSVISLVLSVLLMIVAFIFGNGSWWLPMVVFFGATVACSSAVMIVVCKVSKKALLREENESWH